MSAYDGGGLKHEEWCDIHWDCCGYCKCGAQFEADCADQASASSQEDT
jgi:hypothetical protein